MKMNIKGLVFVGFAAAVFASAAQADIPTGDNAKKTVTSVNFTEATYVKKNADITGATKTKITYDAKGLVTGGADLTMEDLPSDMGDTYQLKSERVTNLDTPNNTTYPTTKAVADALSNTNSTIGTGTLNVTVGSGEAQSFSANEATGSTVSISVPVKNGAGEGLVPSTGANDAGKYLKADGTWDTPEDTTYTADNTTVEIDATSNNQIKAKTGAITTGNETTLTTGAQVATYVQSQLNNYQEELTPGDFISINNGTISTTYSEGSNVHISSTGAISADDTTYTADNTTVEIDAASNNQIKAKTGAITTGNETTLTTGAQVATYVSGLLAGTIPQATNCSASAPCALVATGASTFAWQPIQQ